jgi:hypothetical protein
MKQHILIINTEIVISYIVIKAFIDFALCCLNWLKITLCFQDGESWTNVIVSYLRELLFPPPIKLTATI